MYVPLSARQLAEVLLDEPNLSIEVRVRLDQLLVDMRHPCAPNIDPSERSCWRPQDGTLAEKLMTIEDDEYGEA